MAQELVIAGFITGAGVTASVIYGLIRSGREEVVVRFFPVEYVGDEDSC